MQDVIGRMRSFTLDKEMENDRAIEFAGQRVPVVAPY